MSAAGRAFTEVFEGVVLYAYDDADEHYPHPPVMPGDVVRGTLTIGTGHTGPDVHPGMRITQQQNDALFAHDVAKFEIAVGNLVARNCTQNQFDALVDFAYNEGAEALAGSTLLRLFNAGDIAGAADQFLVWDVASPGLQKRRHAERALFLKADA